MTAFAARPPRGSFRRALRLRNHLAVRNEVGNRIGQRLNMHALDRAGGAK